MALLQAILHGCVDKILALGFRGFKNRADFSHTFLKCRGFATELALMLLEPLVHCILGPG